MKLHIFGQKWALNN